MDSMLDLEQLRLSISEHDVGSAIGQVHQWIDSHGLQLLKNNQKLPFNYDEAEFIRKQHEKLELKCMTFLAFYAKINLKDIPEEYEEMREEMDVKIHKFSDHIKARRHVVVSSFTLFRHLERLGEKLVELQNEDLSDLPDTIEDINFLIEKFHKSTNHSLKKLADLKEEAARVKSSMDNIVTINNSPSFQYVDRGKINEAKVHIDQILRQMEEEVTKVFEAQRLLELELKIEAKMMKIEDDVARCCGWLQKMEQRLVEKYKTRVVGMATVENDLLIEEVQELVNKMKLTNEYGGKLMNMYEQLCLQFKRDTTRGQANGEKLEELWRLAELLSMESLARLSKTGKLYHGLDTTLDKVEDMLVSINKERENGAPNEDIVDKYQSIRDEANEEFQGLKKSANELFNKLRLNLFNDKLKSSDEGYHEGEEIEEMIKMKLFTIAVKLKELDRCIFQDGEVPPIISRSAPRTETEPVSFTDDSLNKTFPANVDEYLKFLNTSRLNWESKPLPKNFDEAVKATKDHQDISKKSEQYWKDIQASLESVGFQLKAENDHRRNILSEASKEKKNWDNKWKAHLEDKLNPRYLLFKKMKDFNLELDEDIASLSDLLDRPNHTIPLVRNLKKELTEMKSRMPAKIQTLESLHKEAVRIHKSDFKDTFTTTDQKLEGYRDQIENALELEDMIGSILEFLPELSQFKKSWNNRVKMSGNNALEMNTLSHEADQMKSKIERYNVEELRNLATLSYGNSKRVEWIIEELEAEFSVLPLTQIDEEIITPKRKERKEMASFELKDTLQTKPRKEHSVNAYLNSPTEMYFELNALPKVEQDQYNIQWYKNNVIIDPTNDIRIRTECEPQQGIINMKIEKCDFGDAGKYWCEVKDSASGIMTSHAVNLKVIPKKVSVSGNAKALFDDYVFAGRNDPLTLELKLDGYRFAPESEIRQDNVPINVNQRQCPWTRVSTNSSIEFCHPAVTDSDEGHYEFMVGDNIVAETQIVVGDAPKLLQHHFQEEAKLKEPFSIIIPTLNIENKADQEVVWKKDGRPLSSASGSLRFHMNAKYDPVLEIEQVSPSNAGEYTCEVFNKYGRTSAQIMLNVKGVVQKVKEVQVKSVVTDDKQNVDKLCVIVGGSVILDIDYAPATNTIIDWTKDGTKVAVNDRRIKISTENNSRCTLQIDNTKISDSGMYTATVKGTNRKQSTLLEIIQETKGPVISKYPQSLRVNLNEALVIDCLVKCQPPCNNVKWTLQPVNGGPMKVLSNNVSCKLTTSMVEDGHNNVQKITCRIDKVNKSDAGEYVVRCENEVGWTSVKIPVSVMAAEDVQFKKKPPTFVQLLNKEIYTSGEEPVVIKCKVTGNPLPTVKWLKDGREVKQSDFIKIKDMADVHDLTILNPRVLDSGTYEVVATNSQGSERSTCCVKVDPSQEVPVSKVAVQKSFATKDRNEDEVSNIDQIPQRTQLIFANTVVRTPPQFATTFTDEIVEEGDDVVLKCCLAGQPEPVVWWSYNTHLLKNPRCEMTRNSYEYCLKIHGAKEEDSGRYSMTAENSSGLATCSALVIVDKNHNKGKSLDRSLYKANSKPRNPELQPGSFPCHTTLSHSMNPALSDESKVMQVSPRGWDDHQSRSSTPRNHSKVVEVEEDSHSNVDFSKTKTKTVKTYRYSGPGGVDLPGIGFIPKLNVSPPSSSTSSEGQIGRAVFVAGPSARVTTTKPVTSTSNVPDTSRFSVVESSDCDYPL